MVTCGQTVKQAHEMLIAAHRQLKASLRYSRKATQL